MTQLHLVQSQNESALGPHLGSHVSPAVKAAKLGSPSGAATSHTWPEFYQGRNTASYRAYVKKQYAPFLSLVWEEVMGLRPGQNVLELGCGIGTVTRILADSDIRPYFRQPTYIATDADAVMLETARETLQGLAKVFRSDIRQSGWCRAKVVHSHGVLEHLDDLGIYQTLEEHARAGVKVAIHYVPGDLHIKPSFGDERLMSLQWWINKWSPDEAFTFNGGKDYVLTWRF